MKSKALLLLVPALLLVSACAPKVNDPADVQAIKQMLEAYAKATNAKDADGLLALLTDRIVWSEAHMPPAAGKEAVAKMAKSWFDMFDFQYSATVDDVRVSGNLGVARETWKLTFTPKAKGLAAATDTGTCLSVLERQADGSWKWDWVIANSSQPMPGATADGAEEQALIKLEQDWTAALMRKDVAALDRILAAEWAFNLDGKITTKTQQLAKLKSGALQVEAVELSDLQVRVFGNVAVASMIGVVKGKEDGKDFSGTERSVDFFVKRDGRWQAVSTQNISLNP